MIKNEFTIWGGLGYAQIPVMNSFIAQIKTWKARAEKAEKRWELLTSKFPGVAETIEDLIEKEGNEHEK